MDKVWDWISTVLWVDVQVSLIVSLVGLGAVYFVGRMEGWINSYRGRNSIYAIVTAISTWVYTYLYLTHPSSILEWIWVIVYHVAISYIIYTLVYMKLYKRLDKVQDQKIAED